MNNTDKLANALRGLYALIPFDGNHDDEANKGPQLAAAREALAAYDAAHPPMDCYGAVPADSTRVSHGHAPYAVVAGRAIIDGQGRIMCSARARARVGLDGYSVADSAESFSPTEADDNTHAIANALNMAMELPDHFAHAVSMLQNVLLAHSKDMTQGDRYGRAAALKEFEKMAARYCPGWGE